MLVLRVGTTSSPVPVECAYCSRELPAFETFYVLESMPMHKGIKEEFSITCPDCYQAIKDAALKHKLPIEWNLNLKDTRAGVGLKRIDG